MERDPNLTESLSISMTGSHIEMVKDRAKKEGVGFSVALRLILNEYKQEIQDLERYSELARKLKDK